MPDLPSTDRLDPLLDRLLQTGQPAQPSFAENVMNRIRNDAADEDIMLDEWLEAELSAARIEPSEGFTERTLARIHRKQAPLIRFPFPLLVRTAAGMAAAVAILLGIGHSEFANPTSQVASTTMASTQHTSVERELQTDTALATLLMLAEDLNSDARWLLHGEESATLLALAQ